MSYPTSYIFLLNTLKKNTRNHSESMIRHETWSYFEETLTRTSKYLSKYQNVHLDALEFEFSSVILSKKTIDVYSEYQEFLSLICQTNNDGDYFIKEEDKLWITYFRDLMCETVKYEAIQKDFNSQDPKNENELTDLIQLSMKMAILRFKVDHCIYFNKKPKYLMEKLNRYEKKFYDCLVLLDRMPVIFGLLIGKDLCMSTYFHENAEIETSMKNQRYLKQLCNILFSKFDLQEIYKTEATASESSTGFSKAHIQKTVQKKVVNNSPNILNSNTNQTKSSLDQSSQDSSEDVSDDDDDSDYVPGPSMKIRTTKGSYRFRGKTIESKLLRLSVIKVWSDKIEEMNKLSHGHMDAQTLSSWLPLGIEQYNQNCYLWKVSKKDNFKNDKNKIDALSLFYLHYVQDIRASIFSIPSRPRGNWIKDAITKPIKINRTKWEKFFCYNIILALNMKVKGGKSNQLIDEGIPEKKKQKLNEDVDSYQYQGTTTDENIWYIEEFDFESWFPEMDIAMEDIDSNFSDIESNSKEKDNDTQIYSAMTYDSLEYHYNNQPQVDERYSSWFPKDPSPPSPPSPPTPPFPYFLSNDMQIKEPEKNQINEILLEEAVLELGVETPLFLNDVMKGSDNTIHKLNNQFNYHQSVEGKVEEENSAFQKILNAFTQYDSD